jgi:DUF1680 family protein
MLLALLLLAFCAYAGASEPELKRLQAIPFTKASIDDEFWAPRREINRTISLPHSLAMLRKAGNITDFELAAAGKRGGYIGPVFMDSDLYKAIEAICYSLATHPDPTLERQIDEIIAKIAAAQRPDGYLDTYYEVMEPDHTYTNLRDNHELYCAGHLIEAAVAHYKATGKRTLLDVAIRLADHIASYFGDAPGRHEGYPGHPELELALVKLWRATGDRKYFELASYFVNHRGSHFFAREHHTPDHEYNGAYWQDDVPLRERATIAGHAVRAAYLLSGVTDVAAESRDAALLHMLERVWRNTVERRMYVTGGIGPSASNEGFTTDYDLPNLTAYQETCASVALILWNHRLNLLFGDAKYADVLEQTLYNGMLAGGSPDGKRYFYVNPLESSGNHHRSQWFSCACCPPNFARLLSSLGEYIYAEGDGALWVNLYVQGELTVDLEGHPVRMQVQTRYPWDGRVRLTFHSGSGANKRGLRLRIPGWCSGATLKLNGKPTPIRMTRGYAALDRVWAPGDVVDLDLPMPVRKIAAHPAVKDDVGKLAIARGPLIYCLEACDNETPLAALAVPSGAKLTPEWRADLLGGVVVLKGRGETMPDEGWAGKLYRTARPARPVAVTAVPYCLWDNRAPGPMRVWIPTTPPPPVAGSPAD